MTFTFIKPPNKASYHNAVADEKNTVFFTPRIVLSKNIEELNSTENNVYKLTKLANGKYTFVKQPRTFIIQQEFGIGKLLISSNFATCQIVLAKLKNGEFALYHSASLLAQDNFSFETFFSQIKDNFAKFYLFSQKKFKGDAIRKIRENVLHLDVAARVGQDNVVCLEVNHYRSVLVDAVNDKVFLSDHEPEFADASELKQTIDKPVNLEPVNKIKTLEQAIEELTGLLKLYPNTTAGDNVYIKAIREKLNAESDEENDDTPAESKDTLLSNVVTIVDKYIAEVAKVQKIQFFSRESPKEKADSIRKSLIVAQANFRNLSSDEIKKFFQYREGNVPSLEKSLSHADVYTPVIAEVMLLIAAKSKKNTKPPL